MTVQPPLVTPIDLAAVRTEVAGILGRFLTLKADLAVSQGMPAEVTRVLESFVSAGGKRLRPLLCVAGWHAAGGHGDGETVLKVAASLEMFHAFALIHDDIMDRSATRHGKPTIHRALAALHTVGRSARAADQLGASASILVGDLALTWADELLHTAGLTAHQLAGVLPLLDAMRTEVMYGQYLDLTTTGRLTDNLDRAFMIIRYKTAKYTVERPLHIGATLAGADDGLRAALSEFALPLGEAFQLRDDLLGVFGDPAVTGKSVLDDLRAGKPTVLAVLALRRATPAQATRLAGLFGRPDLTEEQADVARQIITGTGARRLVESMISERRERALASLDTAPLAPAAVETLRHLAEAAVSRHA